MTKCRLDFEDLTPDEIGKGLNDSAQKILKLYEKDERPSIQVGIYNSEQEVLLIQQIHSVCAQKFDGAHTFEEQQKSIRLANNILNHISFELLNIEDYRRHKLALPPGVVYSGDLKNYIKSLSSD